MHRVWLKECVKFLAKQASQMPNEPLTDQGSVFMGKLHKAYVMSWEFTT